MRLRLLLPLFALLSVGGLTWIVVRSHTETPEYLLTSARLRRADPLGDIGLALREIQEGLRVVRSEGDSALFLELLRERARVHTDQGLLSLALRDLERILSADSSNPDVLEDACRAALWLDDPARALELARRLEAFSPAKSRVFVGRARVALADRPLAQIKTMAHDTLAEAEEQRAVRLAHRAAVFAADADLSEVAREELAESFPRAEDQRLVEELVHEAAEHLEIARTSFVASLEPETSAEAVAGLQDLLLRAGADVDAAELGEVALSIPGLSPSMPILVRTAPTLLRLERREAARALILRVNPDRQAMSLLPSHVLRDELLEWCLLLEDLNMWGILRPAALELEGRARRRPNSPELPWANYFLGRCELADNQLSRARNRFDLVSLQSNLPPEMAVRTWLGLAEIAAKGRDAAQERFALLQATKFPLEEPEGELRGAQAAAWDRLSVLTRARGDAEIADHWLTQALRLEPTEARLQRWETDGKANLSQRNFGGPYRDYSQALARLERGDPVGAAKDADDLLKRYPDLAVALEIQAQAALEQPGYRTAVESSLRLLEQGWHRDEASRRLGSVPPEYLVPADRLRWLRLDPKASLGSILRRLEASGDAQRAALAARTAGGGALGASDLARAGRLLLEAGLVEDAARVLGLATSTEEIPLGLLLRSGLALAEATGDEDALLARLEEVSAERALGDPDLPLAVDALLVAGRTAAARRVVDAMAAKASPLLGPALLRAAVLDLLEAEGTRASEAIERAAALLPNGVPELGRLLLASDQDEPEALPREARGALATPLAASAPRALLLALLCSDVVRAHAVLESSALDGREPLLALAAACVAELGPEFRLSRVDSEPGPSLAEAWDQAVQAAGAADWPPLAPAMAQLGARNVALVALAADVAPFSAWALARLETWPEEARQDPWCDFLRARALLRLGAASAARAVLDRTLATGQAPPALWSARAELAVGAEQLPFWIGWLRAAGLEEAEDPDLALWQAAAHGERGERGAALACLERGLMIRPEDPELLAELARLETTTGRRARAVERWNELLEALAAADRAPFVLPALDNLRLARDEGEISESRWWSEVEALEAELPNDPAPVRELTQRAFETPRQGHGRTLALERMRRFRTRTLDRPVESLRAGEARRWTRLLARFTPDGAVAFAGRELAAAPYSPEVWRAWIESLIAAERWNEALEDLEAILAVAPDLDTARLSALTGYFVREDARTFLRKLDDIEALDPEVLQADLQLAFFRGVAALRTQAPNKNELAQQAWDLWERRQESGLLSQRNGRALAISLFAAGRAPQAEVALSQCLQSHEGALAADVTKALGFLIRTAPAGTRLATEALRPATAPKKAVKTDAGPPQDAAE